MGLVKNLLAFIGLLAIISAGYTIARIAPKLTDFDPGYQDVYLGFAKKLLDTKDPGSTMVYSIPVKPGVSVDDVKESLKSLASARDFLFVGESPFYKQVQASTGQPYRHISFLSFCDARVGKMMADYNDVYTAFMPCRISVVTDKQDKLWLHTMSLDMMIHGGKKLPPDLKKEATRVWGVIQEIMRGAAAGEI